MSSKIAGGAQRKNQRRTVEEDRPRKSGRRKKNRQKQRAQRRAKKHESAIKDSVSLVKKASSKDFTKLDAETKVNEQELFAAMMHKRLAAKDVKLGKKFSRHFEKAVEKLSGKEKTEVVFRAARQAMRKLVKKDELIEQDFAGRVRRFAAGKAQLDDNKELVQTGKLREGDQEPVKVLDEALSQARDNQRLTKEEHSDFKSSMNDLISGKIKPEETHECDEGNKVEPEDSVDHVCDKTKSEETEAKEEVDSAHDCEKVKDKGDKQPESTGDVDDHCAEESEPSPVADTDIDLSITVDGDGDTDIDIDINVNSGMSDVSVDEVEYQQESNEDDRC